VEFGSSAVHAAGLGDGFEHFQIGGTRAGASYYFN
jgi:hypothetical protein